MSRIQVLIIDDSPEDAELYAQFLSDDKAFSYEIHRAETASEGLAILETLHPDIILLDYLLPDMTGLELVVQLREKNPAQHYAIIMLSNMGNETIAVQALQMGISEYISKEDVTADNLPLIVHNTLNNFLTKIVGSKYQYRVISLLHADGKQKILNTIKIMPNFSVVQTASISKILPHVDDSHHTILLTDYYLPDGTEAIPFLHERYPKFPIIVISSTTSEAQAVVAIKQGAEDYLSQDGERIKSLRDILLAIASHYQLDLVAQQAVRELQHQQNIFELFVEHTPAAVAMFDKDMDYIVASRQWYLDYNINEDNIIGKNHYEIFPEVSDEWKAIHQECLQGAIRKHEADAFPRFDGSVDYLKWEVRPWFELNGTIGGIIMFTQVITDQVKIQKQLAQSELLYQQLASNLPDTAVIMFDQDMRYTLAHGHILEQTGYNPDTMIGKTIQEVLPLAAQQALIPEYKRVLKGEEFHILREAKINGNDFAYQSQFVPIFDFDQLNITGMMVIRDITNQHLAQKWLRESEQRFRGIFNQTFQFVSLLEPDGTVLEVNDTALAFASMGIEELINKPFWETLWWSYSEEIQERLKEWIKRVAQGEFIREECLARGKDGSFITIDFSLKPLIDDGEVVLLIAEGRDISERIQIEQKLNQKYEELDRFFSVSLDLLCIADLDGNFVRVNNAFEQILGYTVQELEGQSFLQFIHPKDMQSTLDAMAILEGQDPIMKFTNRYRTKSGDYRFIEWRSQPHGKYIYAAARDITAHIESERDLKQVVRNLQQVNEEIQQFAHIISHDLRAPLINIKGFISILEKAHTDLMSLENQIKPQLDEQELRVWERAIGQRYTTAVDFINNSVNKMDKYTASILKLARIGRREFTQQELNLEEIVTSIVKTLASQIQEYQISIRIDDLPKIKCDELAIDQIFTNLITNAVKYQNPERQGNIRITADIETGKVIFKVIDNGRGIAETDYSKVFAPFRRIGQPTAEGEGMGLAYVQALVRGLDGEIWFDSILNEGTTFSFSIPQVENNS